MSTISIDVYDDEVDDFDVYDDEDDETGPIDTHDRAARLDTRGVLAKGAGSIR